MNDDDVEYVTFRGGSGGFVQVHFRKRLFERGLDTVQISHRRRAALLIANIAVSGTLENDTVMPPMVVPAR